MLKKISIILVLLITINIALADKKSDKFNKYKTNVLFKTKQKIDILQSFKGCVDSAQNKADVKSCRATLKATKKANKKARKEARKAKRAKKDKNK